MLLLGNISSDGRISANVVCNIEVEHSRSMLRNWASSSSYVIQLYLYHNIQQPGTLLLATLLAFQDDNFIAHHLAVIDNSPFHLEERNQYTSFSFFAPLQNPVAWLSNALNLFSSSRKSSGSSAMRRQSVLLK